MRKFTKRPVLATKKIYAAEDDFDSFDEDMSRDDVEDVIIEEDDALNDTLDDMQDAIEDMQDAVNEVEEDDIDIDVNNNITDHYIAECEKCKGVFISAVLASDSSIRSVTGICPLCGKESTQYLKWLVVDASEAN